MSLNVPASNAANDDRLQAWVDRFHGYRVTITRERIEAWLQQFAGEDAQLAADVLNRVNFVTHEEMENAIRDAVNGLSGWHAEEGRRRGKWRFVAFSSAEGESGGAMLHKARNALRLNARHHNRLFIHKAELLAEGLTTNDNVVFVDDFAGTGKQASEAWQNILQELLPGQPVTYLLLVAAARTAMDRIARETRLKVVAPRVLDGAANVLGAECEEFTGDEKNKLLLYCERADRRRPRGYGDCGLLLVLAHKTPNNSLPILHADNARWHGLFPR